MPGGHRIDFARLACSSWPLLQILKPSQLVHVGSSFRGSTAIKILDVGCGNRAVRYFRAQFPNCRYYGVDSITHNITNDELGLMTKFFQINLDSDSLQQVPDADFDLVVLSHVLEHLAHANDVLRDAVDKLRPGGIAYVAHPHHESVRFPSKSGTLNFYDDPSHARIFEEGEVAGLLKALGFSIIESGRTQLARNLILFPPRVLAVGFSTLEIGPALWDLYRFEEYCVARKGWQI